MANDLRIVLAAAAFAAAGLAHSSASAQSTSNTADQSNLRDRIAAAVEMIEGACATDVRSFCGNVTRGEGRLVLCMQAYDDQLSKRCQFALYRVSRNLGSVLSRVDRIADACWNDIQEKCGDADKIGQCVMEKRTLLSQPCQTVINDLRQAYQGLAALRGLPVHGSDDKELGQVVEVNKSADGKIQSIQLELGRWLGLGSKAVTITADKFEQLADRIKLRLRGEDVQSMPDASQKPTGK
jgi:PRC-barrel domain